MADHHNAAPAPDSRAAVEEIDGGARVVFTPSDPARVGVLREEIRVHGKEMASTGCGEGPGAPAAADRRAACSVGGAPTPAHRGDVPRADQVGSARPGDRAAAAQASMHLCDFRRASSGAFVAK